MTEQEVSELVRLQANGHLATENLHEISLGQALVPPQWITVIVRTVRDGRVSDAQEFVWLIGKEKSVGGYSIVMREDGLQFGLASRGFPADDHPVLCGWYGGLLSAFLAM
jgi:hypothetical protein